MISTSYDKEANAVYLLLTHGKVKKTVNFKKLDKIFIDKDEKGNTVGIEILLPLD